MIHLQPTPFRPSLPPPTSQKREKENDNIPPTSLRPSLANRHLPHVTSHLQTTLLSRGIYRADPLGRALSPFLFIGDHVAGNRIMVAIVVKNHEGELWYCVEMVITYLLQNVRQTIHGWKSVAQYSAMHTDLRRKFDLKPGRISTSASVYGL